MPVQKNSGNFLKAPPIWLLFFLSHSLVIFFLFVEVVKKLKREKEKYEDAFKLNFYFRGFTTTLW